MSELFWMRLHLMGVFVGTTLDLAVSFFAVCRNINCMDGSILEAII